MQNYSVRIYSVYYEILIAHALISGKGFFDLRCVGSVLCYGCVHQRVTDGLTVHAPNNS